jgi:hypothetical protein
VPDEPETKKPKPAGQVVVKDRLSRSASLKPEETAYLPEIPDETVYLAAALFEAGPTSIAGMGDGIPLTWFDLNEYQKAIGVDFNPWELRILRRLSSDYLRESHKAKAHDAPPPWIIEMTSDRRAKVANHIKSVMRSK